MKKICYSLQIRYKDSKACLVSFLLFLFISLSLYFFLSLALFMDSLSLFLSDKIGAGFDFVVNIRIPWPRGSDPRNLNPGSMLVVRALDPDTPVKKTVSDLRETHLRPDPIYIQFDSVSWSGCVRLNPGTKPDPSFFQIRIRIINVAWRRSNWRGAY